MFASIIFIIFLGFLGFSALVKDKFRLDTYFIPFLYFTSLSTFVYIFGLANFMKAGVYIFHLMFALIFLIYLFKKREVFLKIKEYFIFLIICLGLIAYLYRKRFIHYDDFSHWGLITRFLLENDRFNGAFDKVISFNSYPQMSAYFIYGILRPIGFRENLALIVNAIGILAGYFVIFIKARENKFLYPVLLIFSAYVFMDNSQISTLQVDTLIATSGFALLAFATSNDFYENKSYLYLSIPMVISVSLQKNSSIFFILIFIIYVFKRYVNIDRFIPVVVILSFLFAKISWDLHLNLNFTDLGKHSMSLSGYRKILLEKDLNIIIQISKRFLKSLLAERFILMLLIILIVSYFINKKDNKLKNIFLFVIVTYIFYQLGNYFMYVFSMPTPEALKLAGYPRYVRTIRTYLILISFYWLDVQTSKITLFAISIFMIYSSLNPIKKFIKEDPDIGYRLEKRQRLEDLNQEDFRNKNILIKMKEKDSSYYYYFMSKYLYQTEKITITYPEDDRNINKEDFDYIIEE